MGREAVPHSGARRDGGADMKIYYDGDCTYCSHFVKLVRLRKAVAGDVQLISLRDDNPDVARILRSDFNVNSGFVVEHDGKTFHGAGALHYLSTLTEPRNILSRLLSWIGASEKAARLLYPVMVIGRYLLLILQGGALIDRKGVPSRKDMKEGIGSRLVRLGLLLLAIVSGVRLGLGAAFPLPTEYLISVSALAALALTTWIVLFLRASYARAIYARIRSANWQVVVLYVCSWLLVVNAFDMIAIRRVAGFLAVFPLLGIAVDLYRNNRAQVGRVPAAVPFAILVFAFFPGLYLAPFYGGIAGWTLTIDRAQPVSVGGYKLVNEAGEEIWYNHAFFQPISQNGRFLRAFRAADLSDQNFMQFMFENYAHIYPTLEGGRMPHEWALGRFAYPSHNLSDSNARDYVGRFAPNRIVEICVVTEYYSRDGKFLRVEKSEGYHPKALIDRQL